MAYAIMRSEKRHRAAVHGIMIEANRSKSDHENGRDFVNSDIDWDKTDSNVFLVRTENWNKEITRVIHAEGLKERKDSVVLIDTLYTASSDFFAGKSRDQIVGFFRDCLAEHEKLYGRPINAAIHFDEATPHMQVASIPIVTDANGKKKLSAKELMGGRAQYQIRQDQFYEDVGKKHGLERGEKVDYSKPAAERKKHTTKREHKIQQQEAQISTQKAELGQLHKQVGDAQLAAWSVSEAARREEARVRDLQKQGTTLETQIAENSELLESQQEEIHNQYELLQDLEAAAPAYQRQAEATRDALDMLDSVEQAAAQGPEPIDVNQILMKYAHPKRNLLGSKVFEFSEEDLRQAVGEIQPEIDKAVSVNFLDRIKSAAQRTLERVHDTFAGEELRIALENVKRSQTDQRKSAQAARDAEKARQAMSEALSPVREAYDKLRSWVTSRNLWPEYCREESQERLEALLRNVDEKNRTVAVRKWKPKDLDQDPDLDEVDID